VCQGDGVIECEASAGPDRKMHGSQGIADEHHVTGAPSFVPEENKISPGRFVRLKWMPAQICRENLFAILPAFGVVHPIETGAIPGCGVAFNNECTHFRAVSIMVRDKRAVIVRAKRECQAIETLSRFILDESVGEALDARTELLGEGLTRDGVYPIGR